MKVFVGMRKALMAMLMQCDAWVLIDGESSDYCIAGLSPWQVLQMPSTPCTKSFLKPRRL
jgi:hypothetical protein